MVWIFKKTQYDFVLIYDNNFKKMNKQGRNIGRQMR